MEHHKTHLEKSHWGERAATYMITHEKASFPAGLNLCNMLQVEKSKKLIEVGCGPGALSLYLLQQLKSSEKIVSCDLSEKMIELANQRKNELSLVQKVDQEFLVLDLDDLSKYEDGSFDTYICSLTLHHSKDLNKALQEARRVLVNGGKIGIIEMGPKAKNFIFMIKEEIVKAGAKPDHSFHHLFLETREKLVKVIEDNNFQVKFFWESGIFFPLETKEELYSFLDGPMFKEMMSQLNEQTKVEVKEKVVAKIEAQKKEFKPLEIPLLNIIAVKNEQ